MVVPDGWALGFVSGRSQDPAALASMIYTQGTALPMAPANAPPCPARLPCGVPARSWETGAWGGRSPS